MRALLICVLVTLPVFGQAPTSSKYPISIHVTQVRMEKSLDIRTSHSGHTFSDDYVWNVLTCGIDGHTYGLKGKRLELGWYAGRKTKHGYEIEHEGKALKYLIVEER